jgi:glyoxylase-like metal-dependent hydrolase (beta-lactamase superfamily II)
MLVGLDGEAYILAGDACVRQEQDAGRCLPGLLWSPDAIIESWEKIEEMRRRLDAKLLVTHDLYWEDTVKLEPEQRYE